MINFKWNSICFNLTDIGGGALGENIPRHTHAKNSWELHFILSGEGDLITDTQDYKLKAGDFFITGDGLYHSQTASKDSPVEDVFFLIQANSINNANTISSAFLSTSFYYSNNVDSSLAQAILKEYREKSADYQTAIEGMMITLLTNVTRRLIPEDLIISSSNENYNDRRFVIIENTFLYTPDITLPQLSEKIGLCERQTQRLLKRYYNMSFREKRKEALENYRQSKKLLNHRVCD